MIIKLNNKMKMSSAFSKHEFQPTALYMELGQFHFGKHPQSRKQGDHRVLPGESLAGSPGSSRRGLRSLGLGLPRTVSLLPLQCDC